MKYYVQEKGSCFPSLEVHASGPLTAEGIYIQSNRFSGNAKYLIMVWHIEELSEYEFYQHIYYFDERGVIYPNKYVRRNS